MNKQLEEDITPEALRRARWKQRESDSDDDSIKYWDKRIRHDQYEAFWITVTEDEHLYLHVSITQAWGPEDDDCQIVRLPNVHTMQDLLVLARFLGGDS